MANKKQEKLIFDTLSEEQKDFFIQSLEKKVRNLNKKLKEIKTLEADLKSGKELKEAQFQKIASKDELNGKRKELEGIAKLYLEAKAESAAEKKEVAQTETTVATAPAKETVEQIAALFFAAQYAYQSNSNTDLALYFTTVFNNVSPQRVANAVNELTHYTSGQNVTLQAQVVQVLASDGFLNQSPFVNHAENVDTHQAEEEQEPVEEPEQTQQAPQTHETTEHTHHHKESAHEHHHQEKPVEHHQEQKSVEQSTEQHEQQQVQDETTTKQGETNKENKGDKNFHKKPYQKRNNSGGGNQGYRKPREPRGEGEHTQQTEGGEHKRGHRQHHNGPRHGGNRSNNKVQHEGENQNQEQDNENQNTQNQVKNTTDDGWNVVVKVGPKNQEGGYKPRNREGGNHHYNNQKRTGDGQNRPTGDGQNRPTGDGQNRPTGDGQNKRPNNSGNKRPYNNNYNKERTGGEQQQQYVRKEKPTNEATEQPAQN